MALWGLGAYQLISLGLSAVGIGIQAGVGAEQPRETEQEKQIRRNSEAHRRIAATRVSQARMGVGNNALRLLSTSPTDARNRITARERGEV